MVDRAGAALPRRLGLALAAIPVVAVLLADAVIAVRSASPPADRPGAHRVHRVDGAALRATQVRALLDRRARAVLDHDEAAFLATVDSRQHGFLARQRQEFRSLSSIPFSSYSYAIQVGDDRTVAAPRLAHYATAAWAPPQVTLHYAIRGFDAAPTALREYPTFVRRGDTWRLASLSDFAAVGDTSDVDIWDFGPIVKVRAPRVLALGHPSSTVSLRDVADEAAAAIPRVSAVWGDSWPRRVVVLVPSSQSELARIVGDKGDLSQIAAVASAEVQSCPGPPDPVGSRVGINPANWGKLSPLGRRIVLTHELTHVATRSVTGSCMPTWLVEGLADYVGYLDSGVPVSVVAEELGRDVRAGDVPSSLPPDGDFAGGNKRLPQAYEGAWMACRLVADRWGEAALVRLYRAVGTSQSSPSRALAEGMRAVLGLSVGHFTSLWRSYLRAQLS